MRGYTRLTGWLHTANNIVLLKPSSVTHKSISAMIED